MVYFFHSETAKNESVNVVTELVKLVNQLPVFWLIKEWWYQRMVWQRCTILVNRLISSVIYCSTLVITDLFTNPQVEDYEITQKISHTDGLKAIDTALIYIER